MSDGARAMLALFMLFGVPILVLFIYGVGYNDGQLDRKRGSGGKR